MRPARLTVVVPGTRKAFRYSYLMPLVSSRPPRTSTYPQFAAHVPFTTRRVPLVTESVAPSQTSNEPVWPSTTLVTWSTSVTPAPPCVRLYFCTSRRPNLFVTFTAGASSAWVFQ